MYSYVHKTEPTNHTHSRYTVEFQTVLPLSVHRDEHGQKQLPVNLSFQVGVSRNCSADVTRLWLPSCYRLRLQVAAKNTSRWL